MRLHIRIVNLEELASPLIGPPAFWERDLDYDGPGDDAAICQWLFQRLNRYAGDARERLDSVGYYRAPARSLGSAFRASTARDRDPSFGGARECCAMRTLSA